MLEYQQKVQAMTDLERTGAELSQQRYLLECARQEEKERQERAQLARHTALTHAIEAAERRGYERGAEEMRERAAQFHRDQGVIREQCGDDVTAQLHWNCAYVIGRLPLTPEEPA